MTGRGERRSAPGADQDDRFLRWAAIASAAGVGVLRDRPRAARATVTVERVVAAPPEVMYELVSDVSDMGRWSPETAACRWVAPATGPAVGAWFRGENRRRGRRWTTTCTVIAADPGRRFGFDVVLGRRPVSRWTYAFEPHDQGCRIVETWTDLRPVWVVPLSLLVTGVASRADHNRATMQATLAALAAVAEHLSGDPS
jgi:uncharacterized protein YndB with AHSA1/START domain